MFQIKYIFSMKKRKYSKIVHIMIFFILIVIMPHILSAIFSEIAKFGFYPIFCKERFFEEYYKYLFNFITMIAGFWYANTLIEERIKKEFLFDIGRYRHLLDNLKKSVIDLKTYSTTKTLKEYREKKSLFISNYKNMLRYFPLNYNLRFHFQPSYYELYEDLLEKIGSLIKLKSPGFPANNKLEYIIAIIEKLEKEF